MTTAFYYTIFGIAYLIFLIYVGFRSSKKVGKGDDDYVLAGRAAPWYLIAGSLVATWVAPGAMMAYVGMGAGIGLAGYWSGGAFMFITIWIGWWMIPKLRRSNVVTVPELFGKYFGKNHRFVALLLSLGRDFGMAAVVLLAMGIMFNYVYDIGIPLSLAISLLIVLIYTWMGGAWAVLYTDFVQAIILVIGTTIALPIMISNLGGLSAVHDLVPAAHVDIWNAGIPQSVAWFLTAIFISFGYQTVIQRGLAAKSDEDARKGFAVGGGILTLWFIVPFAVGVLGSVLYPDIATDQIYLHMAKDIVGPALGAFFFVALLAAAMGTADSVLVTLSSNVANDVIKGLINPKIAGSKLILIQRIAVVVVALLATVTAYSYPRMLELCWTGGRFMAAALAPAFAGLIFFPKLRKCKVTVMAAMIIASLVTLRFQLVPPEYIAGSANVWALDPILAGLPICIVILIVGSIIETRIKVKNNEVIKDAGQI